MQYWLEACAKHKKPLAGMSVLAETALLVSNEGKAELSPLAGLWEDLSSIQCSHQDSNLWQRVYQEQPTKAELLDVLFVGLSTQRAGPLMAVLSSRGAFGQWQQQQWLQQQHTVLQQLPEYASKELMMVAVKHQNSGPMVDTTVNSLSNVLGRPEVYGDAVAAVAREWLLKEADFPAYAILHEATAALSAAHVCELIKAATAPRAFTVLQLLLSLRVTCSFTADQVADVLLATVQHNAKVAGQVCKLPAAKQLTTEQVIDVLAAAVPRLPNSSSRSSSSNEAANKDAGALKVLLIKYGKKTPIAQEAVLSWLHSAARCDSSAAIEVLCNLPAAQELAAEQVAGLLWAAIQCKPGRAVLALASQFSARQLGGDKMAELITAAVHADNAPAVQALCRMGADEYFKAADAAELFRHAVQQQHCETAAELLLCLRSGEHLDKQTVAMLGVPYLLVLLQAAVQQWCRRTLDALEQVLDPSAAVELLQLAILQGGSYESLSDMSVFEALCQLPGLQEIQPQHAVHLLLLALQHDNTAAAKAMGDRQCVWAERGLALARNVGQLLQLAGAKGLLHANLKRHIWFAATAAQLRSLAGQRRRQSQQ
jgi:hypothetical protein